MTREDLARFCRLNIDFAAIGLAEPGVAQKPYFCTPVGAENVAQVGSDGVHFVLLPEDERIFCVEPSMGAPGTYVLPVAANFREFLSFVLFCGDANPLSQIFWMEELAFRRWLEQEKAAQCSESTVFFAKKQMALSAVAEEFGVEPRDPFASVKALQATFDTRKLRFSGEYYDVLGLMRP